MVNVQMPAFIQDTLSGPDPNAFGALQAYTEEQQSRRQMQNTQTRLAETAADRSHASDCVLD